MLNIEIPTMLFQLGAFIVLMLLVSKFALRPILNTMKQRQDHIESQIKAAEQNRLDAEKLIEEQKEALKQARQEAKEIIERAKAQKEREAEEIIRKAQERAERMIQEATTEIQREKEKALASLRDEVGALSVQLASKMLEKELDQKGQAQLVNRYLEQVGRLQ
ncbi:F0F1 ATP synthase subunit B [Lihuaxuella thermophila]|uniref:ATP synthase subunit b n=1 Tax=Lihuaxuella thermophila TaxID=1173111 RepID=A0A1H8BAF4_9BACL|nr:F0F1 ATP synthase subunit B [Lihuaxuella thermophila]SEM79910.1 F-type H+-transporting ATPase subunit b [Lihuaxuella thermophila]